MEKISVELLDFGRVGCLLVRTITTRCACKDNQRCKAQMEWFDFFSALHLGQHLYCLTDNLSKDLQGTKMAAVSGQRLANLTKGTLTKIRIDQSFDHFYANVARKSEGLLGEPTLPRKRHTPARLKVGAGAPSYPQTAKDHFGRALLWGYWSYRQGYLSAR